MATTKTDKKPAEKCRNCGVTYSYTRPKCLGRECINNREYRDPDTGRMVVINGVCIQCCFTYINDTVLRERYTRPEFGDYVCYVCARTCLSLCKCCNKSILCTYCCDERNHKICCKRAKIEFKNTPLEFAHPGVKETGWLTRDQSLAILNKTYPLSRLNPKGFTINSSRRYAAVEIEVFSYEDATELNKAITEWQCSVVHDGSILREAQSRNVIVNVDRTFEINTSPACGNALYDELAAIAEGLVKAKAEVTTGCGIHVHVDCRDYTYQDLQKFIKVYYYIEDALFAAVHWTRASNDFCKPCGVEFYEKVVKGIKPEELKAALIKNVYGENSLKRTSYGTEFYAKRGDHYGRIGFARNRNEKRYAAINYHSYFLRGSVESRIHHGSISFDEIYNWAKLQVDLFDAVIKTTDSKLSKLLEIAPYEISGALELIAADKMLRPFSTEKLGNIATGVVLLRSLLPDASFQVLLDKIKVCCHDPDVSQKRILPCQLGKEVAKELIQNAPVVAPEVAPNAMRGGLGVFEAFEAVNLGRFVRGR